jgi:outer membrane protein TolC
MEFPMSLRSASFLTTLASSLLVTVAGWAQVPEAPVGEVSRTLEQKLQTMMSGQGLTSETVVQKALQNSDALEAKRNAIESADWSLEQARASFFPQLTVYARYKRYSHIDPPVLGPGFTFPVFENEYAAGAQLNVPLSDYVMRLGNAVSAARAAKDATMLEQQTTRAAVARDARVAYYQWIRAQGTELVAAQALAQAEGHLKDTQSAFAAGMVSKADVLRAQSQQKSVELFLERSKTGVLLGVERLRSLMKDHTTPKFEVGENVIKDLGPGNWPSYDAAYSEALANRPELKSLQALERSAHDQASLSGKANWPRLDGQANAMYINPHPRYVPPNDVFKGSWDVGVTLSWTPTNIFGNEAAAHSARAKAAEIAAQRGALQEALRMEIQQALQAVKEEEFAITATRQGLDAAEEGYRVRRELYRIGRATLVEVMDAETELTRARLEAVNAHIDYRIARTELNHALGRKP